MVLFRVSKENHLEEIPIEIIPYRTFWKRLKGLMFRKKPITNEGIIITPCNSIHMFFMFFPIDIIFINKKNKVVYLKESVQPWTVILPVKDAYSAIELPDGTISDYSIRVGHSIQIH